jgi:hypothetical protein
MVMQQCYVSGENRWMEFCVTQQQDPREYLTPKRAGIENTATLKRRATRENEAMAHVGNSPAPPRLAITEALL